MIYPFSKVAAYERFSKFLRKMVENQLVFCYILTINDWWMILIFEGKGYLTEGTCIIHPLITFADNFSIQIWL